MSDQNVQDIYPLSPAQQGMLLYLLMSSFRSEVYFEQYVASLGSIDPSAMRSAWQRLVDRHAALRTFFVWEKRDQPLQVVRRQVQVPWQEHDWRDLPAAERDERFAAFLREDQDRGFDFGKAPLTRVALVRFAEEEWKIVWSFSHLVLDGWSLALVLGELKALYAAAGEGRELDLPAPRPYRDYIGWLKRQDPVRAEEYWRRTLGGFEPPTPLPFDGGGAPSVDGRVSGQVARLLAPETVEKVQALVRRCQITANTLFQGLWALLLGRWSAADDVVYGAVVSGRPFDLDGVESMIGLFINALPVRLRVDPAAGLGPWLQGIQAGQFEQRELEYCANEKILVWAGMPRNVPLYESLLVYENYPSDPLGRSQETGGLKVRSARLAEAHNTPLTLYVTPLGGYLELKLFHHWQRFDDGAAERILDGLEALLAAALEAPESRLGDLPLVRPAERAELLAAAAGPRGDSGGDSGSEPVHRRFQQQAARTPDAPAVVSAQGSLTYAELDRAARRLAGRLRAAGVGAESIVGLCAERSPEMVTGMLAVLEAGGAYLPLDPAYPPERLAYMLDDSGARVLLAQERLLPRLAGFRGEIVPLDGAAASSMSPASSAPSAAGDIDPAQPAYVIYTSGSTGRPKGVVAPHASLAHYVDSAAEAFGITAADRVLQFASISFDTSAEEIYPCLTRGGALVLRDDEMVTSLDRFVRETGTLGISVLDLPTAYWHELVAEMEAQGLDLPASLRLIILGGEQAQRDRLEAWGRRIGDRVRLVNTYGPTEATIVSTRRELSGAAAADFAGEIPIGRPIGGARGYVAGPGQELLPRGLDGELLLGGAGLTRGYLGRPELTAERFVPDPYSGEPGARLYRTGDLVRWLPGGDLQFRGRTDNQVKVRGFRIELGEIEAALRALPAVRDAVVVARAAGDGGKRLAAYVLPEAGSAPAVNELRSGLQAALPTYMVPSTFALVADLPRTPSGKVDRRAVSQLPAEEGRPDLDGEFAAPRNPVEDVLCDIWSDLLGVERVGIHDDFFQLGGHSLLVAKLASRVRQTFGRELSMVKVFQTPTVAALAAAIERGEKADDLLAVPPIRRAPRDRPIPLSYPQERVWFLDQLTPGGNIAYNFQFTLWLQGPLRVGVLDRTLTEIVRRHEVLRTSFPAVGGRPAQVIHEPWRVSLPVVDLAGLPAERRHEESEKLVYESTETPFDVSRLPLLRWRLLRLEEELWEMVQVEQHFVHDGWSFGVFLKEVKTIYTAFLAGEPSPLPELPVQFADFATWQHELVEGPLMERLLGFWKKTLAGSSGVLDLPTDRPRPNRPSFEGDITLFRMSTELYEALRTFGRRQGFTLYMTTLAGFFSLLHRYTGQDDILLGTNNANRRASELEGLIGMIVNTLVVRGDLTGNPDFRALLGRVRDVSLETYTHQDMPFERLVQEIRPERQLGRNPLFQVMFNFHDAAVPDLDFADLRGNFRVRGNRSAKMDMNVILVPGAEQRVGLQANELDKRAILHWEYNTDLFDFSTIQRMIGHFQTLLAGAVANPSLRLSELPLLNAEERRQTLIDWNDTAAAVPEAGGFHELFEAQARRTPDAVAVTCEGSSLTYRELDERAGGIARRLRELGVGPEVLVGVSLQRSLDLPAALLGVLKAGGAYVPLDPAYPADRLGFILEDGRVAVLITERALRASLPESGARVLEIEDAGDSAPAAAAGEPLPAAGGPESTAYVIYTSGSTGRPKGVEVRHRGVINFLASMARQPGLGAADVMLAVTTVSFDIAVLELFLPLTVGARVELAGRDAAADGARLAALLESSGATAMQATPATWRMLIEAGWPGKPGLKTLCGGEALAGDLARELLARAGDSGSLWNLYGPTETTVWSALLPVTAADALRAQVPVGRPIANTAIHLLDRNLEPVPAGIPGELYIGGEGLARGYLRRPELTAERFVPDPLGLDAARPGGRLYRAGDLARYLADGSLEFLGRVDHQVKVRGFRIEPGEIEAALLRLPGVRETVVLAREDRPGDRRLVAYVVADGLAGGEAPVSEASEDLRQALGRTLPAYMVPALVVFLERLPLTPSGKIDRRALPAPEIGRPENDATYVAPRTPVEATLAGIWSEVLGVERVGARDDFFALGGHSLTATSVLARVRDALRVDLPLSVVFERRTVEGMAAAVEAATPAESEMEQRAATLSDSELDALLGAMLAEGGRG